MNGIVPICQLPLYYCIPCSNLTELLTVLSCSTGVSRIGLPPYSYHSEGLHGIRDAFQTLQQEATLFPQITAMAATGNLTRIAEMASIMGVEARALSNLHIAKVSIRILLVDYRPTSNMIVIIYLITHGKTFSFLQTCSKH